MSTDENIKREIPERLARTEMILGPEKLGVLMDKHVAVFGLGGVGGYVCEALARSGVGKLTIVDNDDVDITNLNRQIIATTETIGRPKTDVMAERIKLIAPEAEVIPVKEFFLPETSDHFDFNDFDYVVDAVDTVKAKIELAIKCQEAGVPVISSMGAGNRMDPAAFRVSDISKTEMDPLARVMRRELRNRGIKHLKVVFSKEKPVGGVVSDNKRHAPGSISFCPGAAGLIMASEIIKDLTGYNNDVKE